MCLKNKITERIIKARSLRFITNCYSMKSVEKADSLWVLGDSFLFAYEDHGINRLYFYVRSYSELNQLLEMVDKGEFFLDIMTSDPNEYFPPDSTLIAKMMRMSNSDCRSVFNCLPILQYRDDSVAKKASKEDAHEINQILWDTFHTEISHLLYEDEMIELIEKGQVFIHRDINIDAILQVEIMPKKFYINQVINKSDKKTIHAMLLKLLWDYTQNGGKYLYSWVEDKNIASVRFHAKYGMKHDGMWNLVYCVEKSK